MNLLQKLGFRISKPTFEVKVKKEVSEASRVMDEKRKALYEKDARETAALYHGWLSDDSYSLLCQAHDYTCVMWGSRKFGRLMNLSRNILDIEILKDNPTFEEKDRLHATKMLMWMSLLFPVPIKRYHLGHNAENECREELFTLLKNDEDALSEAEISIILEGVFEGVQTLPGNPLLDIFHDALRFEEAQFGKPCDPQWMRTELGNNSVFRIKAHRDATANRCPDWVGYLQGLKGKEGFVNVEKAEQDSEYAKTDTFTG